jgi:hypothetical protein
MTRRDYDLISKVLARCQPSVLDATSLRNLIIYSLANALAEENPRFDRERFMQTCSGVRS